MKSDKFNLGRGLGRLSASRRSRRRSRAHGAAASRSFIFFETLESRMLLSSYSAGTYFPLTSAATWGYTGTDASHSATVSASVVGTVTVDSVATTEITQSLVSNGQTTVTTDFYTNNANGLDLYRQDISNARENISVVFATPINLFPATFSDGDLYNFSGTGTGSGTINGQSETFTESITSGAIVIVRSGSLTVPAGTLSAVQVTEDYSYTDTRTGSGAAFTRSGSVQDTDFFAADIGLAQLSASNSETINATAVSDTPSFKLSGSSLLPSIALAGNSVPIVNGSVSPSQANFTNFGNWGAGTTLGTLTRTYVVANIGGSDLGLSGSPVVAISGADASDFTVLNQPSPTLLTPGASDTFTIEFVPTATQLGLRTATVTIKSTDPALQSFTFEIEGASLEMTNLPISINNNGVTSTSTMQYATTIAGTGPAVIDGEGLEVDYSGYLLDGTEFDSSLNPGRNPFLFTIGEQQVIAGWDQGMVGMQAGEHRTMIIPADLGYGANGSGSIPANAVLIFNVVLDAILPNTILVTAADGAIIPTGDTTVSVANGTSMGQSDIEAGAATPTTSTFTMQQVGTLQVNLNGQSAPVEVTGANAKDFTVSTPVDEANNTLQFTVTFKPTSLGYRNATISIPYESTAVNNGMTELDYTFNVQGMGATVYFDSNYYLSTYSDVAAAVKAGAYATAWDHYWLYGQYEGRSPSPYFDEALYLQQNPDVASAVKSGQFSTGFIHFVEYGAAEGRTFNYFYSESFYLSQNLDVAAAVKNGQFASGFEHFLLNGQYEDRAFSKYFDETLYLDENPDVAAAVKAGDFTSGFEHFELYGFAEGRQFFPLYSESFYLEENPDVAAAVHDGDFTSGFQHLLEYGLAEGRDFSPYFDEADYLARYPDVAAAVKAGDFTSGLEHFVLYGQFEGRDPN